MGERARLGRGEPTSSSGVVAESDRRPIHNLNARFSLHQFMQHERPALGHTAKNLLAKTGGSDMMNGMKSVLDVEKALRQMPPEDRWEIARWLLDDLQEHATSQSTAQRPPTLPDYSGRRRRIFGDKVLPNMVLAARAEESW